VRLLRRTGKAGVPGDGGKTGSKTRIKTVILNTKVS